MKGFGPLSILWLVSLTPAGLLAQSVDERLAIVDEVSRYDVNLSTPLNQNNQLYPQSTSGNILTASLGLSMQPLSTTIGFASTAGNATIPSTAWSIRELALDVSLTDELDLLVGRKILKWGTGYAFNPTGVVEPQRTPSDPTDRLNQNEGRSLVSLTAFLGKNSLTFVYLNDVQYKDRSIRWDKSEYAFRAYAFLSGLDLSLIGHLREGDPFEAGANCSYVIGENLELHGEVLFKRASTMLYHPIIRSDSAQQEFTSYPYTAFERDSRKIFAKTLVGGQFTFDNGINIILEYYRNNEGLNSTEWKRWMNFVKFQNGLMQGATTAPPPTIALSRINALWALQTLSPRGTLQDYLFGRGYWSDNDWSIEAIVFVSVDGGTSLVLLPTVTRKIASVASVYLRVASYQGAEGTEFGSLFTSNSFTAGIQVQL